MKFQSKKHEFDNYNSTYLYLNNNSIDPCKYKYKYKI